MKIKLTLRDAWWSKDKDKYLSIKVYGRIDEVDAIHNAVLEAIAKLNKKTEATED